MLLKVLLKHLYSLWIVVFFLSLVVDHLFLLAYYSVRFWIALWIAINRILLIFQVFIRWWLNVGFTLFSRLWNFIYLSDFIEMDLVYRLLVLWETEIKVILDLFIFDLLELQILLLNVKVIQFSRLDYLWIDSFLNHFDRINTLFDSQLVILIHFIQPIDLRNVDHNISLLMWVLWSTNIKHIFGFVIVQLNLYCQFDNVTINLITLFGLFSQWNRTLEYLLIELIFYASSIVYEIKSLGQNIHQLDVNIHNPQTIENSFIILSLHHLIDILKVLTDIFTIEFILVVHINSLKVSDIVVDQSIDHLLIQLARLIHILQYLMHIVDINDIFSESQQIVNNWYEVMTFLQIRLSDLSDIVISRCWIYFIETTVRKVQTEIHLRQYQILMDTVLVVSNSTEYLSQLSSHLVSQSLTY